MTNLPICTTSLRPAVAIRDETMPDDAARIVRGEEADRRVDVASAVMKAAPEMTVTRRPGCGPQARTNPVMDLSRMRADTNYEPRYDIDRAIQDYVDWLRKNPQ